MAKRTGIISPTAFLGDLYERNDEENRANLASVLHSKNLDILREDLKFEAYKMPNLNGWSGKQRNHGWNPTLKPGRGVKILLRFKSDCCY